MRGENPSFDGRMHDAAAAALSYLDSLDPALAADARTGWDGLLDASPASGPTQTSVQTYLWSHLRYRLVAPAEQWDIACALGDLLERLGHVRYAHIARSEATRALLYISDETLWQQAYLNAMRDAGTAPEDTELVTWQDNPVDDEQAIIDLIGETLEVATVAGEFDLSLVGDQATPAERRRTLTDAVLRTERAGTTLLELLLAHRIALWSAYSMPRAEMYRGLSQQLHESGPVDPVDAHGCTARLSGLLELIGDGAELTDMGMLPSDVIDENHDVTTLRRLLIQLGLMRRRHGRLIPTRLGSSILGGGAPEMFGLLIGKLVGVDYRPEAAAAEVVLTHIARGANVAADRDDMHRFIESLLAAEGWTHAGETATASVVIPLADALVGQLTALGAVTAGGRPTSSGRALAVAIMRYRLLHTRFPTV